MTRSPRSTSSDRPLATTSGFSRQTSRRASTRSRTPPFMDRVRRRVGDKRVLGLVKAFLRRRDPRRGWRQQGHDHRHSTRRDPLTLPGQHRPVRAGRALRPQVGGARAGMDARQASQSRCPGLWPGPLRGRLRGDGRRHPRATPKRSGTEIGGVLAPIGLRLSEEKTRVCHIDEGFDFLGCRIQRRSWRGRTGKRAVYTYPSKKALASVMGKVRSLSAQTRDRAATGHTGRQPSPGLRGSDAICRSCRCCSRARAASRTKTRSRTEPVRCNPDSRSPPR